MEDSMWHLEYPISTRSDLVLMSKVTVYLHTRILPSQTTENDADYQLSHSSSKGYTSPETKNLKVIS